MKSYSLRLVPLVAAVLLTSACSSLNPFASSAAKPAALVDFTPSAELASTPAAWDERLLTVLLKLATSRPAP